MDVISGGSVIPAHVERFRSEARVAHVLTAPSERERQRLSALDDMLLVGECTSGNTSAFDELVVRYRDRVIRLVASVLGAGGDVEDIVQEIFIKVYLSLGRFRGESSFSTYLYTTAVNRCRDELRKLKLRRFFSFDDWFSHDGNHHPSQENGQQLEQDERREVVRTAMKRLPIDTQMLLYLREIEEMSYKELADVFDVEIGTIKSRLARGRDRLRDELLPYIRNGALPGCGDR